jgi:hypothetical protein
MPPSPKALGCVLGETESWRRLNVRIRAQLRVMGERSVGQADFAMA